MGTEILVLLVLILLNAFFAGSEIALISLNDNKVRMMADAGDKKSQMVHNLISQPSRFLATIQIGITLAGFLASAFAADSFASRLTAFLYEAGVPIAPDLLNTISVIVITLLLSYFTLVFGELVPKQIAMTKPEPIANLAVRPLTLLSKITAPFVKLLTLSMNVTVRLFGIDPNADDNEVTEEEIRMMVDAGEEKGTIQLTEKEMINNIFDFDIKTVSDIMTHRTNILAIPLDATLQETVQTVNKEKYTRYPVYAEDVDHIVGILHSKDLIQFLEDHVTRAKEFNLQEMIRDPHFVLESTKVDHLFREMQQNNIHLAIVIDEYGGTDGIVTIEDIIEEIVGNIFDEYDEPYVEEPGIMELDETTYLMDGTTNLYDVEDVIGRDLPTSEYDTLSGFLINLLGYIPIGENKPIVEYNDVQFAVVKTSEKRIMQVKVNILEKVKADED
ncbi:hemolysin family protein [Niallia sp. Krafla_26]|uniref:hemolysin family protein n=1 Tax=Niallia sp. Krafla_26 TaxID=3064703 RepID=UPI003D179898